MARKRPIPTIFLSENALSLEECTLLITLYDRYSELTSRRDYNSRPLLDYYTLRGADSKSASWVHGITIRCQKKVEVDFGTAELFVESFFVACLFTGDSHIPHADNERLENGEWIPNHTPQRDYTGIAYLNEDFTGGDLVFPELNIAITPKAGLLVGFPSNHNFVHAVPEVLSGKRYSLPVWFTLNSAKAMQV